MDREFTSTLPQRLLQHLRDDGQARRFRRRAVLTNSNGRWELVCCTVEGFLPGERMPDAVPSRRYQQAILHEDLLVDDECLRFAQELHEGHARFADLVIPRSQNPQWTVERLPVANEHMTRAGYAISMHFAQHGSRGTVRTLLAVDQPYYPDSDEAARDWLPFPIYHGHDDGRNDKVVFLLPESRAYIADVVLSEEGALIITIAGSEASALPLLLKGACWEGKTIHQLRAEVRDAKATLVLPHGVDRLEYFLIGPDDTVYDFQREDRVSFPKGRKALNSMERALEDLVRKACRSGEGLNVEFKPFIELSTKQAPKEDIAKRSKQNPKLREVVETVAAFANAEGDHIYLGVNDDCTISGIGESLREWTGEELSDASIARYLGTLNSRIKELVHGEVALTLSHIEIEGMLVGIVEVARALHGPVALQQEYHLYIRGGASNRKAPPDQWHSVLNSARNLFGLG